MSEGIELEQEHNRDNLPSKVAQFDNMSVRIKQQVLWFDVSVTNTHLVNVGEGTSN